jgi:16S rRNA processing protein RimM
LRGAAVCVPREAFPPAEEGEFYACDLEGAQVILASGEVIGRVRGISTYPTCDALIVELNVELAAGTRPASVLEIPLTESYVASVDVERRTIAILTLEGLL